MTNRIIQFASPRARNVRGTKIEIGAPLFAIQDEQTRLYFIWAYVHREMAERVGEKVKPDNETDIAANWRRKTDQLVATARND